MINKDKLIEMAKARGVLLAEDSLESGAKGLAHLAIDIIEELVKQSETPVDDLIMIPVIGPAREMADKIEVNL